MAFFSSRIEEIKSKLLSAAGAGVEFEGLTDVETGGVSGLEDESHSPSLQLFYQLLH